MKNYGFHLLLSAEVKLDFCVCCSTWMAYPGQSLADFLCLYGKTGMKFRSPSSHIGLDTLSQAGGYIAPKCNYVTLGAVMLPPAVT